jgi:DHA2 family lincomycin resistance protein-like MFS transporter
MNNPKPVKHAAAALTAIAIGAFLATFNETFLNVVLTPMMHTFHIHSGQIQWVSTAYMLVAAAVVPMVSFLYRSVPTRRLTAVAFLFLLAGSLIGGFATAFPVLILSRCVQAVGTGMIVPIGMNLTLLIAPEGRLGTYMGVVSAVTLLGPAFGPIAGGLLLSAFEWHVLFFVFSALVAAALVINLIVIDDFAALSHPKLDVLSVLLVSLTLLGIMYGIATVFSSHIGIALAAFVIGIVCAVAFVRRQHQLDEPLLDMRPFEDHAFVKGVGIVFIAFMSVFAMNILLPLYMQNALGFSALGAALTLLAPCLSCVVFAPLAGHLYDRYGFKHSLPISLLVMAAFLCLMACLTDAHTAGVVIAAIYLPILAGCNFSIGPAQSDVLDHLSSDLHPHGVTICYTAIQTAGCFGSSLYVGIMGAVEQHRLAAHVSGVSAVTSGFHVSCMTAAVVAAVGFALALSFTRHGYAASENAKA